VYGISSLLPACSKINAVSAVVSRLPTVPAAMPGVVPPTYITWWSSTARAGIDKIKRKKRAVSFFKLHLALTILVSIYAVSDGSVRVSEEDLSGDGTLFQVSCIDFVRQLRSV